MIEEKKEKRKVLKKGDRNYVNNKEFTLELDAYARAQRKAINEGKPRIQMNRYLAESITKMARRLCTTKRFSGYSYKDEMIQNGILAAVKYCHNFDGSKFNNGFAYVTQILFSHMIITIKNEKKMYETKMKLIQQMDDFDLDLTEKDYKEELIKQIADQKLYEMEKQKVSKDDNSPNGFSLRTGYTKEERASYAGGTALWDEEPEDKE